MIDEELESEGRITREAEYVGIWMLLRSGFRGIVRGIKGLHRHHHRVWAALAAILWLAFAAFCIWGTIELIHIQTTERTCQLMGTCK